jgi:DNA-binding transcriptional ArsR family regulator
MDERDVVTSLSALAQPIRLQVFRAPVVAGPEGLRPGVLSELLSVAPPSLSFHLKELMRSALVSQRREGRKLICRAELHHMNSQLGYLTENCCQGEACLPAGATDCDC